MQHLLRHKAAWYTNWFLDDPQGQAISWYLWFKVYTPRQMDRLYDPDILGQYVNGGLGLSFSTSLTGKRTEEYILPLETARDLGNYIHKMGLDEVNAHKQDKWGHQGPRDNGLAEKYVTFTPGGGYATVYITIQAYPTDQLPAAVKAKQSSNCPHGVMGFAVSLTRQPTLKQCMTVPVKQGKQLGQEIKNLAIANLRQHGHM